MNDDDLLGDLRARHPAASICGVAVELRDGGRVDVVVRCARPAHLIGMNAATATELAAYLRGLPRFCGVDAHLEIVEVRRAELEPLLVADAVVGNLSRGVDVDRTLARWSATPLRAGARAVRVVVSGAVEASSSAGDVDAIVGEPDATLAGVRRRIDDSVPPPADDDDDFVEPPLIDVGAITCDVWLVKPRG